MDDPAQGAGTLAGRTETHGRPYPHLVEKACLLLTIISAVFAARWMWVEMDWPESLLWFATLCVLPIITLIIAEGFARIVQAVHSQSD